MPAKISISKRKGNDANLSSATQTIKKPITVLHDLSPGSTEASQKLNFYSPSDNDASVSTPPAEQSTQVAVIKSYLDEIDNTELTQALNEVKSNGVPQYIDLYQNVKPESFAQDQINGALWQLNQHMNIFFPSLYYPNQMSKLSVKSKKVVSDLDGKTREYINIYYTDRTRPQKLVCFQNVNLIQFTLMTPFGAIRYPDPFPFGSCRNRWNDPNSEDGKKKDINKRVKIPDSKFSFEMTSRSIDDLSAKNDLIDQWFDYCEHVSDLMLFTVATQLEALFPHIHSDVERKILFTGQKVTPETIAVFMKQNIWQGLITTDANNTRRFKPDQRVFRYATKIEKEFLAQPHFQSKSGNSEITKWLVKSLTSEDSEGNLLGTRWENDIPVYKCRNDEERKNDRPEQLFEALDYNEAGQVISDRSSIISTIFSLKLNADSSKIYLRPDVKAYLWFGSTPKYQEATNFELPDPMSISFSTPQNNNLLH